MIFAGRLVDRRFRRRGGLEPSRLGDRHRGRRRGQVQDRPWLSARLSLRAEVCIKGNSHHFCLGVRVSVCGARLTSRKLLSALCPVHTCIAWYSV